LTYGNKYFEVLEAPEQNGISKFIPGWLADIVIGFDPNYLLHKQKNLVIMQNDGSGRAINDGMEHM
jgi:hypothetical protein